MHEINRTNGKDSIVWTGQTPWHRLGSQLPELFTAEEALREGGLDYEVEKAPLFLRGGKAVRGRYAIQRSDTGAVLGICSQDYQPVQNRDAFGFFDGVFGADKARYEVAGVLGAGECAWALAKVPGDFRIVGDDVLAPYLLLSNGFDGRQPVRARFTTVRVVCANTLRAALGGKTSNEVRVMHVGDVNAKLKLAGELLSRAGIYYGKLTETFQQFQRATITPAVSRQYALAVLAPTKVDVEDDEKLHGAVRNRLETVQELVETGHGADLPGVRGTVWGTYNALTEYVDHHRTKGDLGYLMDGAGARLKARAFDFGLDLVKSLN